VNLIPFLGYPKALEFNERAKTKKRQPPDECRQYKIRKVMQKCVLEFN